MRKISGATVGLAAAAVVLLAVVTNVATSTIELAGWAKPWVWAATAVLGAAVVLYELYRHHVDKPAAAVLDVDAAIESLAVGVGRRWHDEERRWRVHDPYPLPVRWDVGPAQLTDHWANIRKAPPGVESTPLALAADMEKVAAVYRRIPSGRLVVLGRAGAGKTVLAVRLVADLLAHRDHTEPVPVLFAASSWDPLAQPLDIWLAARLVEDYPGLAALGATGATLAAELVRAARILPILDGFDEIAAGLRTAALSQLNDTTGPLVLTSRAEEYADAVAVADVLTAAVVVTLADLAMADLAVYLTRATAPTVSARWVPVLAALDAKPVTPTATALATPLMVYLARTVYGDTPDHDPSELLDATVFPTSDTIEDHLLDGFIPAIYDRRKSGTRKALPWDDPDHAQRWHSYLARHLCRLNSHDLAWWQLRDTIPPAIRLITMGLAVALPSVLTIGMSVAPLYGLASGFLVGLAIGLPFALPSTGPKPTKTNLQIHGRVGRVLLKFVRWLLIGLVTGLLVGLVAGPFVGLAIGIWVGPLFGLVLIVLEDLASIPDISTAASPVETLRMDRSRTVTAIIVAGLVSGIVYGLVTGRLTGLAVGLSFGLIVGFLPAWGQWLATTRIWLPLTGQMPWRIVGFLTDAHDRGVLRQAGGIYRYRHVRLRDRLADKQDHNS
ncbi:NACHT domain-containing protein [Actinoplanes sp. CA-030573]|uniref:NACHT domain-containing protein n=1 Tax=Actinoplanes sp. CA-030573 TaxID=3239898 RepID=UPI003D8C67A3